MVSVAVPNGPVLVGDIVAANPVEAETDRKTVLLNPLIPWRLIADVAEAPTAILSIVGLAVMVKSGVLDVTVTDTVVECDNEPLVPVTVAT